MQVLKNGFLFALLVRGNCFVQRFYENLSQNVHAGRAETMKGFWS